MRKKIFDIIEVAKEKDILSEIYDWFMMVVILISIVPLAFHAEYKIFTIIDKITVLIFIIDYILRLVTADYKLNKKAFSFILYPFTPMAIVDLISILPSLTVVGKGFRLFKIFRLFRTFKVFRVFKVVRYSKSINLIIEVFRNQKKTLATVGILAAGYIIVSALVVFNAEPDTFTTFFDAVYWATVSLTTMGYGDIFAVTTVGKAVTMASSIFGIAIIALPSGIITAGFIDALNNKTEDDSFMS